MALNLPTFYKRTASSIVFVAIMLTGLLWNMWAFITLICLIEILCLRDYLRLMQKIDNGKYWPKWITLTIQITGLFLIFIFPLSTVLTYKNISNVILLILPIIPAIFLLAAGLSKRTSLIALLQASGGLFYITLPALFLYFMYRSDFILPIAVILMIWSNDTLAYLVGSFIGKNSFSPVSPNKTWEGVIGGALLTVIGAGIYGYFAGGYNFLNWMGLALVVTVTGTLGDLLESKLKRMADVKDSGTLMPGHGGALDRFDSLLVAAPFAFVYVNCFMR